MNKRIWMMMVVLVLVGIFALTVFGIANYIYNSNAKQAYRSAVELLKQKDYEGAVKAYEAILNNFAKSVFVTNAQLGLAEAYMGLGRLVQARDIYKNLLLENLDLNIAKAVSEKLSGLNIKILFSPIKTPDSIIYKIRDQDTLDSIARKYNTTVALIKKANNVSQEVIRPGTDLKITTAKFSIIVDKSQNRLTLKSGEEAVKGYPVSTGANKSTPVGTFKIASKIINPPWFLGGRAIPPGDPKNILGSRWMGLTMKGYGIHGTTDEATIGTQCTQGCVRMHNFDVEELYNIVPIGTEVTIVD